MTITKLTKPSYPEYFCQIKPSKLFKTLYENKLTPYVPFDSWIKHNLNQN